MWRDKIQIYQKLGKPVSKTRQDEERQCGARSGVVDTQILKRTRGKGKKKPWFFLSSRQVINLVRTRSEASR